MKMHDGYMPACVICCKGLLRYYCTLLGAPYDTLRKYETSEGGTGNVIKLTQPSVNATNSGCNVETLKNGGVRIFLQHNLQFTDVSLFKFCREKDLEICAVKLYLAACTMCIITIDLPPVILNVS
jgi:hypothetical protein